MRSAAYEKFNILISSEVLPEIKGQNYGFVRNNRISRHRSHNITVS